MRNRNAASLTGSLLVRKGAAEPSPFGHGASLDAPTPSRFAPMQSPIPSQGAPSPAPFRTANDKLTEAVGESGKTVAAAKQNDKPVESSAKTRIAPTGDGSSEVRRFTLRLSQDQHLKLRIASVHLGLSGQKLILEAVNEYLERVAPELRDGNCACILDGVSVPPPGGKVKPA
ncbi:MAG: hypothetical protein O7I42_01150 [Alphaproteobacteria bacterium]|nr:hypothetical protein [Alphaproteobacteria bacterium]